MRNVRTVLLRLFGGARDLLFPPYCAACGELISPFGRTSVFCPACREAWDDARTVAAEEAAEAAAAGHAYLVQYRSGKTDGTPERFVFHLKHKGDDRAVAFAAQSLVLGVQTALLSVESTDTRPPLVTYAPRSRAAIRKDGFDQAARLARALSREVDGAFCPLLRRRERDSSEQKRLDTKERIKNARVSYALRRRAADRVRGRTVVLCDDLATTGATLARCEKLLLRAGASAVVWATVAQTEGVSGGSLRLNRKRNQ